MPSALPATAAPPLSLEQLAVLVDRFYDRVQRHPELGPVFAAAIDDWPAHKRLLVEFWAAVALRTGRYRGNPMAAHRAHPITAAHFDAWLALWQATAEELLPPAQAALLMGAAQRIGRSLRHGLGLGGADPAACAASGRA